MAISPLPAVAQDARAPAAPASTDASKSAPELTPELMYRLLVADIALQRDQPALAARAYFEAAREAKNAAFARRATEIALATRQAGMALQAAKLWSELDPAAQRPKEIATRLTKEGVSEATVESIAHSDANIEGQLERLLAQSARQGPAAIGEAFLELNRLFIRQSDKSATLKLVQRLAEPYDNVPEAHLAVALAAYNAGLSDMASYALASKEVDRAIALDPTSERAAVLKAEILNKQSADAAVAWLQGFLKAQPNSRPVASTLAQIYVQQKKYAAARGVFDTLLAQNPGNREIRLARAALSMQMKDWPVAEAQFEELLKDGQDEDGSVALYLAEIAEDSGRFPLAIERYRAVPEGERAWTAQLRIGIVLGKMNRLDEARRHLEDLPAVTIDQRVQVRQTEAQVYRDAGDNKSAYAVLEKGLTEHPANPDLLYDAAMVAEKMDRIDLAEAHLRKVVELRPDNAQAWNALGYTLVDRTDRHKEGMEYIQKALKLSPDDAFILDSMGWAHYRMGQLDEAEHYLRRAIAGRPDAEIAAHLGEVLWVKGERDRAQEIWQSQLKSAPDNPVLLETVRRLSH